MQSIALAAAVVAVFALSLGVVWRVERPDGRWRRLLTDRFVYGVPWGTLVTVAFVLGVYLFVQGGWEDFDDPVVIAFRAWSYLYPTGIVTAGFAHASEGHITGNLIGTLVLAPIAEYAWSHYPPERRQGRSLAEYPMGEALSGTALAARADDWRRRPWIRAVVLFPAGVIAVGLFTGVFALGPVIGFSGVVFAFGGFALVSYPVATLVGLLVTGVVRVFYYALRDPIVRAGVSGSPPGPPGWATTAVQGHAIGIMAGVLLGLALLWRRGRRPPAGRIFLATLVYGVNRSLWAVYWFEGDGVYVLYRGLGVVLVTLLALLVVVTAASADRPIPRLADLLPGPIRANGYLPTGRQLAAGGLAASVVAVAGVVAPSALDAGGLPVLSPRDAVLVAVASTLALAFGTYVLARSTLSVPRPNQRRTAFAILLVATAFISGPAVIPNLTTVEDDAVPGEGHVTVEDYTVTYEEETRNRLIPAIELPGLAGATDVRTSGVIVVSERRHIWTRSLSRQYLQSEGRGSVQVGGVGWRETVVVDREGWRVAGNDTVYAVDLRRRGEEEWVRSFTSEPSTADPRIDNRTIRIDPGEEAFRLAVRRDNRTIGTATVPETGGNRTVGGLLISAERPEDRTVLYAERGGTRVRFAAEETYRER